MGRPSLLFYHDGRHPLIYMYEPPITLDQYQQAVDELLGTPVVRTPPHPTPPRWPAIPALFAGRPAPAEHLGPVIESPPW